MASSDHVAAVFGTRNFEVRLRGKTRRESDRIFRGKDAAQS
jgi:hypothetical protein